MEEGEEATEKERSHRLLTLDVTSQSVGNSGSFALLAYHAAVADIKNEKRTSENEQSTILFFMSLGKSAAWKCIIRGPKISKSPSREPRLMLA